MTHHPDSKNSYSRPNSNNNKVRCLGLTSLNITKMISDKIIIRPTRPTYMQPTIFTPVAIETAGTWHLGLIAYRQLSWSTGKAGDHHHRTLQRDHLPVPVVISGFAKGKQTRSRFRTRSQPASRLQPAISQTTFYIHTHIHAICGSIWASM